MLGQDAQKAFKRMETTRTKTLFSILQDKEEARQYECGNVLCSNE